MGDVIERSQARRPCLYQQGSFQWWFGIRRRRLRLQLIEIAMQPLPARSPLVRRLSQTVAMLPVYHGSALADAPPTYTEVGLRYTQYAEDSLSDKAVLFGSKDRYDINITQLWIEAPVGASWSVALDVQNDYQTGASPWFVGATADGSPGVIMSGASIQDNRVEVGVTTRYFWADGNAGFNIIHSDEDDYEAVAWSMDAAWNTNRNTTTWSASASSSHDTVEPTQEKIPVFIDKEKLDTHSLYFGVSQILSRTAVVKVGLSYTYSEGFLSDPYKLRDTRPTEHHRYTLATGLRQHFISLGGSLHADYRFYSDDWGSQSHTLSLGWVQQMEHQAVNPYVRYYSQGQADFFSPIADFTADYYSDDYRLSSFGAITAGLRWTIALGDWTAEAQLERYVSDHSWSTFSGQAAPALVDFWRGTIGISWRFD